MSPDTLLEHVQLQPRARFARAFCYGGYTTNVPLADLRNDQAFIGLQYEGKPPTPEHGAPPGWWCRTSTSGKAPSGCRARA